MPIHRIVLFDSCFSRLVTNYARRHINKTKKDQPQKQLKRREGDSIGKGVKGARKGYGIFVFLYFCPSDDPAHDCPTMCIYDIILKNNVPRRRKKGAEG